MTLSIESLEEVEPPGRSTAREISRTDRVLALAHVQPNAHVVVIGRHTLPALLSLLRRGCAAVRCLRPGAPAPDREAADLAWVVDFADEHDLDEALHAARVRIGATGRIVVDGPRGSADGLAGLHIHAVDAGLDVVSVDRNESCVVLAPRRPLAAAA